MSQTNKQPTKDTNKQSKTNDNEKKNTDAWKEKQAQKKKQKQLNQVKGEDAKQDKKDKKKEKKEKAKEQQKAQQIKKDKASKGNEAVASKQINQQKQSTKVQKSYRKLQTVQTVIMSAYPKLLENRSAQIELIEKEIHNLIRAGDTILHLGKLELKNPKLIAGCGRHNYQLVEMPGYSNHPESEIICRYQDISYLISQEVDKVFLQATVIFENGSALLPKGYENIAILANHYNKPLVVVGGSWNYCKRSITSYEQLEQIYGEGVTQKYDWIGNESISQMCLQFGSVLPSQISYQLEQGYKNYGLLNAKW